jgi:hypothetical protein
VVSAGADLARRTRRDQDLPEHVEEPGTLARIAALLKATKAGPNKPASALTDHGHHRDLRRE